MQKNKYYVYYPIDQDMLVKEIANYLSIKQSKNKNGADYSNLNLVLVIDKEQIYNRQKSKELLKIIDFMLNSGVKPHDLVVGIDEINFRHTKEQWNCLKEVNEALSSKNILFGIEDLNKTWTIDEVEKTNEFIVGVADQIRKHHFTPYEIIKAAYIECTKRIYNKEESQEHYSQSRSVYGVVNSDKIVCLGYAHLLSAVLQEIDNDNIKSYVNFVATSNDNISRRNLHANVIIYVNDKNYGVNGYYYFDPTWDSAIENGNLHTFFMLPLREIKNMYVPYIRSPQVLVNSCIDNSKDTKKISNATFNFVEKDRRLCFSQDRYEFNTQFLADYFTIYPQESKIVRSLVYDGGKLENLNSKYLLLDEQKNALDTVENALKNYQKPISKQAQGQIYVLLQKAMRGNINVSITERIDEIIANDNGSNKDHFVAEVFDVVKNSLKKNIDRALDNIEEHENEIYSPQNLAEWHMETSSLNLDIERKIIQNSVPIDIGLTMQAMKRVYKAMYDLNDAQIDKILHEIIVKTAEYRKESFNNFDSTDFSKYLQSSKLERE